MRLVGTAQHVRALWVELEAVAGRRVDGERDSQLLGAVEDGLLDCWPGGR
ncbi:hypothetical protein [Corynebacterium aquilae]|nr:hypothetical protein [Corynebacterium aquilae]